MWLQTRKIKSFLKKFTFFQNFQTKLIFRSSYVMKGQNMHVKSGGVKQLIYVTAQKI